jgi:23S rRNA pseudouridine2605 synthase
MEERLQKILAQAGFGSRRACEELIRQGRVAVNGQVAQLGQKADADHDRITLDGEPVQLRLRRTYVALNKPQGVLSDEGDRSGRLPTVRDLAPLSGHLHSVGRLDLQSEGLILLTDDGDLTQRLTHPRYCHEKEYRVLVEGEPEEATLSKWRCGVFLDGQRTAPAQVTVVGQEKACTWLRVVLREGHKRQIRHVAAMLGHPVRRLIRIRIGPVHLGDLKPGEWRHLTQQELKKLDRLKQQKKRPGKRNRE